MGVSLDQLPLSGVSPSVLLIAYLTIGLIVAVHSGLVILHTVGARQPAQQRLSQRRQ